MLNLGVMQHMRLGSRKTFLQGRSEHFSELPGIAGGSTLQWDCGSDGAKHTSVYLTAHFPPVSLLKGRLRPNLLPAPSLLAGISPRLV